MNGTLDLDIERPVAGGRMLARHGGQIVFVSGAIPGERVRVTIERASKQSLWASTIDVLEASPDRRPLTIDPACGGLAFAHIQYARQLALKRNIIADAFHRLAGLDIDSAMPIAGSPETGFRLRGRLHVRSGKPGFFLEGTHTLCDAAPAGQLHAEAIPAVHAVLRALGPRATGCDAITISENIGANERVLHLEPHEHARIDDVGAIPDLASLGVTGVTTATDRRMVTLTGHAHVTDTAGSLFSGTPPIDPAVRWTRGPASFFQTNRFLIGDLARRVIDLAAAPRVADVYAGVGLFSIALAARGSQVLAIEGDGPSGADLATNAEPWADLLEVVRGSVEDVVRAPPPVQPDVLIVDPPRTGLSRAALDGLISWRAPKVVYVSCDPPTLARDAKRLVAAGYTMDSVDAFDLFPNTPHVETVVAFTRHSGGGV